MNCMKCGREIDEQNVFCPDCLDDMSGYPVQPDIVVQIPKQDRHAKKIVRKHAPSAEEQLKRARNQIHWLTLLVVVLVAIALLFAVLALESMEKNALANLLGQNYSIVDNISSASP